MVDVQTEIHTASRARTSRPLRETTENAPWWYGNIDSAAGLSGPPLTVGSRVVFIARFLGRTLDYTDAIVELLPNEKLVMRFSQGQFPMQTTYTWSDVSDGTLMTLRNNGEPRGFSAFAWALMGPMSRRAVRKDLANLKSILESQRTRA